MISATGLAEVEGARRTGQDRGHVPHVGVHIADHPFRGAGQHRALQQDPGVDQHGGVVVRVDDPDLRRDPLRDLVRVAAAGSPAPMSRNCLIRAGPTRIRTARTRKARSARAVWVRCGNSRVSCSPVARSAAK